MAHTTYLNSRQRRIELFAVILLVSVIIGVAIITRPKAAPVSKTWKVLPWGDSNTEGGTPPGGFCSINPGGYSYRGNLFKKLVADGHSIDYIGPLKLNGCTGMTEDIPDLDHAGYGAFSISDPGGGDCGSRSPGVCGYGLLENIDAMQVKDADIILLMIGYNGRGDGGNDSRLESLINATMAANPDVILFVGGYPNTPGDFSDMQDLRDKSKQMADQSATDSIYWVDFNQALPDGGDFIGDGVHHSQQGAAKVAQRFYDAIIASGVLSDSEPTISPTPTGDLSKYDIDNSGTIGVGDLSRLIQDYPRQTGPVVSNSPADFNNSGRVDINDLSTLLRYWGQTV